MRQRIAAMALTFVVFLTGVAFSGGPDIINYQGILKDSEETPITGTVKVTFRFYDAVTGGGLLLTVEETGITVENGLCNVAVGSGAVTAGIESTLSEVFRDNSDVWMSVEVGSDGEMTPRQRLASVPFALNCGEWSNQGTFISANNATDIVVTDDGNVGIGTTTPTESLDIEGHLRLQSRPQLTDENTSQTNTAGSVGASGSFGFFSQSFLADVTLITEFGVWLQQDIAHPEGQVKLAIAPDDGSGNPDESAVLHESDLIDPGTTGTWYYVTDVSVPVTIDTKYHVLIDGYGNAGTTGQSNAGTSDTQPDTNENMKISPAGSMWFLQSEPLAIYVKGSLNPVDTLFAGQGDVGIGTINPSSRLEVAGEATMTSATINTFLHLEPMTTTPENPSAGDVYIDANDGNKLKVYDGSAWQSCW